MSRYIPLDEGEVTRLVEYTDGRDGTFVPLVFGTGGVALDVSVSGTEWMQILLADWRGVAVPDDYRAAHPLPERAAAEHVIPDATGNRAGAS